MRSTNKKFLKNFVLHKLYQLLNLCEKVNPSDVASLVKIKESISFDFDIIDMYNKISDYFHTGGFLISNSIKMDFLDSFLEKNKKTFEMLAKEHIKKIKQHKSFKK